MVALDCTTGGGEPGEEELRVQLVELEMHVLPVDSYNIGALSFAEGVAADWKR